jgi:hypothetical protein
LGEDAYAINCLISHDITRKIDIFLLIAERFDIVSRKRNSLRENSLFSLRPKRLSRETLVTGLFGARTASTLETAIAEQVERLVIGAATY